MSRLEELTFITDTGGIQTVKVQNYTETSSYEFFNTKYDEAIDGSLRSNLRGERNKLSISYELSGDPDTYRSILNNIVADFEAGHSFFYVGIDSDSTIRVVLDSDLAYKINYANQHGLFVPSMSLIATDLDAQIDLSVEDWRFINESVTEMRDYGLITESVTTSIDYGAILNT